MVGTTQLRKRIVRAQGGGKEEWERVKMAHKIGKFLAAPSYVGVDAFWGKAEWAKGGRMIAKLINKAASGEVVG
jgi:hypothetical protein